MDGYRAFAAAMAAPRGFDAMKSPKQLAREAEERRQYRRYQEQERARTEQRVAAERAAARLMQRQASRQQAVRRDRLARGLPAEFPTERTLARQTSGRWQHAYVPAATGGERGSMGFVRYQRQPAVARPPMTRQLAGRWADLSGSRVPMAGRYDRIRVPTQQGLPRWAR